MVIRTVDPNAAYDRDNFVNAMEDLMSLEGILTGTEKPEGSWNPEFRRKAGDLIRDDVRAYHGLAPDMFQYDIKMFRNENRDRILGHAKTNFETLTQKLNALEGEEMLYGLLINLPLVKSGNKDIDDIIEALEEFKEIMNEKNPQAYVARRMKRADKDSAGRKAYDNYSGGHPEYDQIVFKSFRTAIEARLAGLIRNGDQIDKSKLMRVLNEGYKAVVSSKGVDSDEAREFRYTIAKAAYAVEKK